MKDQNLYGSQILPHSIAKTCQGTHHGKTIQNQLAFYFCKKTIKHKSFTLVKHTKQGWWITIKKFAERMASWSIPATWQNDWLTTEIGAADGRKKTIRVWTLLTSDRNTEIFQKIENDMTIREYILKFRRHLYKFLAIFVLSLIPNKKQL